MSETHLLPPLSPTEARQIDQACDRFEAAWKVGQRPQPEEFLGTAAEPVRSALLRQLLLLDWDCRRRAGDDPSARDYLTRFPTDTALIEDVCREITNSPVSTRVEPDGRHAQDTPWSGAKEVGRIDNPSHSETGSDRYALLQEVGQGGIGVVFRGRDRHLGRELAVKVLREDYRDKPDARRRFTEEARVGSQLQHPAIVPVYELGSFGDRRPYITMKLVEGHTLAALLQDRKNVGQDSDPAGVRQDRHPAPQPDLPRLLGIFEQVCQAMAYAHARGVVHRDLKPANVMVGAFGEVQVMDWGFAKVLAGDGAAPTTFPIEGSESRWVARPEQDAQGVIGRCATPFEDSGRATPQVRNGVTQSGVLMGTPAYMPPEQARGEAALIDPRADVFALGAILCEVLTGRPPYVGSNPEEVCSKAAEADLGDAHARLDACGADETLRELAKRCLAAERAARPPDAGVVARDLTAYLASAQERLRQAQLERAAAEARAQEAGAKAKAERRARRLTLALAAAAFVLLALAGAGIVGTRLGLIEARRERHATEIARQEAVEAAAAEQQAKTTAETSEAETRAVLDFVENQILAAARPQENGGLGRQATLRQAIEAALPFVETGFKKQPLIEARLRTTIGQSFRVLGEPKTALAQFERAHTLYATHRGPDHRDTLWSLTNLADAYLSLGRCAEALQLREQTLALQKAKLGPNDAATLLSMDALAHNYFAVGRRAEAIKLREETLALQKTEFGPSYPDTLVTMKVLADDYAGLGRQLDALKLREDLLALGQEQDGPEHPRTLASMHELANSYYAVGRHAEALKLREKRLALQKSKLGLDHLDTLASMLTLADFYAAAGRHGEALKLRKEMLALLEGKLALQRTRLGPDHSETLASMDALADSYAALGRNAEMIKLREERLALQKAKLGSQHLDTLQSMSQLHSAYFAARRHVEAIKLREEMLALHKAKFGPDDPSTLACMHVLANNYAVVGRYVEESKLREELLALDKAKLGPNDPKTLQSMERLARSYADAGRYDRGLKLLVDLLELQKTKPGPERRDTLQSVDQLADTYFRAGRRAEAIKVREEILPLLKVKFGLDDSKTLANMSALANAYAVAGRLDAALKLHRETLALRQAKLGLNHPDTLKSMWGVAFALVKLERGAEAVEIIDECVKRAAGQVVDPQMIPRVMGLRLRHFQQSKDAAGCRATAEMWEKLNRTDAASLYEAAWMRAVTAAVICARDQSKGAAKDAAAEADRAMALLRRAVAAGFNNAAQVKRDRDLDILRDRDDFKKLVRELEARKGSDKK